MISYKIIPDEDLGRVIEIYAQGVESGKCTFSNTVPTAEKWDSSHMKECRIGAYDGDRLVGWVALSHQSGMACKSGVTDMSIYIAMIIIVRASAHILLNCLCLWLNPAEYG